MWSLRNNNIMKKILYSIFALAVMLPVVTSAATFSFSPSTGSFAPGETFSVAVYANPSAGEEITTAKLSAAFSVSGLEVVSFSQADGWIPLAAPGSDLIDNTSGKLIKTGGFPARVTASKQFGVIILKAKSAGTATISIEGDSMMLDTANADKFTASTGASFTIVAPVVTPPAATQPDDDSEISGTVAPTTPTADEPDVDDATSTDEVATSTQQSQTAAAAATGTGVDTIWYYILAALALLAGGVFSWRRWGKNSQ